MFFRARAVCPDRAKTIYTIRWFSSSSYSDSVQLPRGDLSSCTTTGLGARVVVEPSRDRTVAFQQRVVTMTCVHLLVGRRVSASVWVASRCWTSSIRVWFSRRHADESRYSSSLSMVMNSDVITVRVTNATPTTSSKYLSTTKKTGPKRRYTKNLISKWFGSFSNACNTYDYNSLIIILSFVFV